MRAWVIAAGLCLAGGCANAQASGATGSCRAITDPAERLRCYDEEASFSVAGTIRRELDCDRAPRPDETIRLLIRRNAIRPSTFQVVDDMNYFALMEPARIDGLTIVAVFGFDENGAFIRSGQRAPGTTFGIVTRDPQPDVDLWRLRHSPRLHYDDTASSIRGAKDIACVVLGAPAAVDPGRTGSAPRR